MCEQESLSARELFKRTYETLCDRHEHTIVTFQNRVLTEIGDDSDYHRTRKGYMGYENSGLFNLNGKTWAISRGENAGGYPADAYDGDILALEFLTDGKTQEQIRQELTKKIKESSYFKNSLIHSRMGGELAGFEGGLGERMQERLKPVIEVYIAQQPEYNTELVLLSTGEHPPTKSTLYKPEFADFLADSIEGILN